MATAARGAALLLQGTSNRVRQDAVRALADAVRAHREAILAANEKDLAAAAHDGLEGSLLDRLRLGPEKLRLLLDGVEQVAGLPDPLGRTVRATRLDEGLDLYQVTVPLGVVGVVFESRPDALVQIVALAVRSGNAVLLKGGREAERTNGVLAAALRTGLQQAGLPVDAVQLLAGREEVGALLELDDLVDLVIPRGSSAFVRHVMDHTRIPVLGHAQGVCHVYVDAHADLEEAVRIVMDAKSDYPAACNAAETVLVHRRIAGDLLPMLRQAAEAKGVSLIEDASGFGVEFGDLRLAVGIVADLEAAIAHVNHHGSRHTEAIVTDDQATAHRFVAAVDAASVMVNASTRFADGYRYGLGAEVGVSTSKVHARGPVGLDGLTTTKWVLLGTGQSAADYQGQAAKRFLHEALADELDPAWKHGG